MFRQTRFRTTVAKTVEAEVIRSSATSELRSQKRRQTADVDEVRRVFIPQKQKINLVLLRHVLLRRYAYGFEPLIQIVRHSEDVDSSSILK